MATKGISLAAFGGTHTAGIFSDMTVDGPNIGTLVVIMDRAKNLPNRRSMGKQDPYCAARLGKEAKKTNTDKRGGQTPRWDQELRFTVHDSVDYQNLKVSVFNDDKKTELIGETWVSLEGVLLPGGGQSDGWHGLMCKGKYAGEIRIELTYYDTRVKEKAQVEKRKESTRPDNGSPIVGGPRESSAPVKRRPLPSDPTGASRSPASTQEHRAAGVQLGPRGYQSPRTNTTEHTPTHERRSHHTDAQQTRRPVPEASPLPSAQSSSHHTPQHQQWASQDRDAYGGSPNPPQPSTSTPQHRGDGYDMGYAAPKPYEVQPLESLPQQSRDNSQRAMSQDMRPTARGYPHGHIDDPHSYSAPVVPTQSTDGYHGHLAHSESYSHMSQAQEPYQEQSYHIAPLRTSRSNSGFDQAPSHEQYSAPVSSHEQYHAPNEYYDPPQFDPFTAHGRSPGAMQPTVEDEDFDIPPPPPVHRSSAATIPHPQELLPQELLPQERPPSYHADAPAPLNISRYREESPRNVYDSPPQPYGTNDRASPSSTERRNTHSRPLSRPVSRDTMAPSPLRNETALPSSLIAGIDPSRRDSDSYQALQSFDTPSRLRQLSEPDYRTPPPYETQSRQHPLAIQQSFDSPEYYPHFAPEEPRQVSPVHDHPLVKPRAMSPGNTHSLVDHRGSRTNLRGMPARKSVSPRPPPSADSERRLSGIAFSPDSFDVYNPTVAKKTQSGARDSPDDGRHGSQVELNDKGQVVTFSGRVIDASDHLPLESWAPEPEPKGKSKDRPARERAVLGGARDIEAARQREHAYRKDRVDRDRIRSAVDTLHTESASPTNALVTSRHQYSSSGGSPMNAMILHNDESSSPSAGGRNRLQKRSQRPVSTYDPPSSSSSNIPMPNNGVLRERENPAGYGTSPSYGSGTRIAAPPIPAKIPLENGIPNEDMTALSMELQMIDIGPGSGGKQRGGAGRRRYGDY